MCDTKAMTPRYCDRRGEKLRYFCYQESSDLVPPLEPECFERKRESGVDGEWRKESLRKMKQCLTTGQRDSERERLGRRVYGLDGERER